VAQITGRVSSRCSRFAALADSCCYLVKGCGRSDTLGHVLVQAQSAPTSDQLIDLKILPPH